MKAHLNGGAFNQVKSCTPSTAVGLQLLKEAKDKLVAESVRNARSLKKRKAEHSAIASLTLPQSEAGTLTSLWSGVSQEQVNEAWARLCYTNVIPFSLMESPWFKSKPKMSSVWELGARAVGRREEGDVSRK
jgi:hypothetical protein